MATHLCPNGGADDWAGASVIGKLLFKL